MTVPASEILAVVGRQLGRRDVKPSHHLREDLGLESIDFLNVVAALEDRWGVSFSDAELETVERVADLTGLVTSKTE